MKLPALHPDCGGDGCDSCSGGFIEVIVTDGPWYTRACESCGFRNGARLKDDRWEPETAKPGPCVMCRSPRVRWEQSLMSRVQPRTDRRYRVGEESVLLVCLRPGLWWDDRRQYEVRRVRRYDQGWPWAVINRRRRISVGDANTLQEVAEKVHALRVEEFGKWIAKEQAAMRRQRS